jgi:hypothetical protein
MSLSRPSRSGRAPRTPWPLAKLQHERAIAIGCAIESSTAATYSSATLSYLNFCTLHNLPTEPTPDSFSFFTVFMSSHIKPQSVDNYLSRICHQLEPLFPEVHKIRKHPLVVKTLIGCKKMQAKNTTRKRPISRQDLISVATNYTTSVQHDDILFYTLVTTAFHGLLRLGEMVWPDTHKLQDYRKVVLRNSISVKTSSFDFRLPGHKADRLFEGSTVLLRTTTTADDPLSFFTQYLRLRDTMFPYHPQLWLRKNGAIPTRSWFMTRFRKHFPDKEFGGHSLRAGGQPTSQTTVYHTTSFKAWGAGALTRSKFIFGSIPYYRPRSFSGPEDRCPPSRSKCFSSLHSPTILSKQKTTNQTTNTFLSLSHFCLSLAIGPFLAFSHQVSRTFPRVNIPSLLGPPFNERWSRIRA